MLRLLPGAMARVIRAQAVSREPGDDGRRQAAELPKNRRRASRWPVDRPWRFSGHDGRAFASHPALGAGLAMSMGLAWIAGEALLALLVGRVLIFGGQSVRFRLGARRTLAFYDLMSYSRRYLLAGRPDRFVLDENHRIPENMERVGPDQPLATRSGGRVLHRNGVGPRRVATVRHRRLWRLEKKRHFLEVSDDVVERVVPVFLLDPEAAAMKASGMT